MNKTDNHKSTRQGPIGIFDSGFGGLTVLEQIRKRLPQYRYLYLGDNARAPYGTRSFDMVYRFTLEAVRTLFDMGCPLVILACNTASAKALRTIQQNDLPRMADPTRRVLGVIRPTAEAVGRLSQSRHVGIFATPGTIASDSYNIEISHLHPDVTTTGHACPMWVPLIEGGEADTPGADYFIEKDVRALLERDPDIDTIILGCTHYPIISRQIQRHLPDGIRTVSQGPIVADSLADYLHRHPEMEIRLEKTESDDNVTYLTTENPERFDTLATLFTGRPVSAHQISLPD